METCSSFLGMVENNGGGGGREGQERGGGGGGCEDRDNISLAPEKLARTDAFPFRMSPVSRYENGPTVYNSSSCEGRLNSLCDVAGGAVAAAAAPIRTLQPFPIALKSTGMASLRLPFTPAQWLELEQQALIFKHIVNAVPVPPDLLRPIRTSLADATSNFCTLGWGGAVSLKYANGVDPEPGRCRRTDGKKWRCSRDVAPDQKYCERHMHRGRPRSRKPVEVQLQRNNSGNALTSSTAHASTALSHSLPLPLPLSSSASSCPSSLSSLTSPASDILPKPFQSPGLKLLMQTTMATGLSERTSRHLNWMTGETSHQWELIRSKHDAMQEYQQQRLSTNRDNLHILKYHDNLGLLPDAGFRSNGAQADSRNPLFVGNNLPGLESTTENQPRRFIDAWSTEHRWLPSTTINTSTATTTTKSSASKLPFSSLSLSMSGGAASPGDEIDPIQMGLGVSDTDDGGSLRSRQAPTWMLPASWQSSSPLGGPLAEALQSSNSTPAAPNSPKACSGKSSSGQLNLMSDGWGDGSPGDSPRMDSSPSGVLQKTLAVLSDSSSGSSPTFGAKSEFALQWLSQQTQKLPSS